MPDNRHLTVVQDAAETVGGAGVAVAEHPGLNTVHPYCMQSARCCRYLKSPGSVVVIEHHVRPVSARESLARYLTVAGVAVTNDPARLEYWSLGWSFCRQCCAATRRSWARSGRRRRGCRRGTKQCSRNNPSRRALRQERVIAQGPVTRSAERSRWSTMVDPRTRSADAGSGGQGVGWRGKLWRRDEALYLSARVRRCGAGSVRAAQCRRASMQ